MDIESTISGQPLAELRPASFDFSQFWSRFMSRGARINYPRNANEARRIREEEEERAEIALYQSQDRFVVAREQRVKKYHERLRAMQKEFSESEEALHDGLLTAFGWQVQTHGVEQTRKQIVPPYAFDKFKELPIELRFRIWSFAARVEKPRIHVPFGRRIGGYHYNPDYRRIERCPPMLHACHESRGEALKVFSLFNSPGSFAGPRYLNTLYDNFYFGHASRWADFKLFVDILIKQNTARALPPQISMHLGPIKSIRNIIVDQKIFGALPPNVWTEFSCLNSLTIAFYPFEDGGEEEELDFFDSVSPKDPGFLEPNAKSYNGARAERIMRYAVDCLNKAKAEVPSFVKPDIKVVQRRVYGRDVDPDDEEEAHEAMLEEEQEYNFIGEVDDHEYFERLEREMTFNVPTSEIKRFKHRYHPSRLVDIHDELNGETRKNGALRQVGEYVSDSETESGAQVPEVRFVQIWSSEDDDEESEYGW